MNYPISAHEDTGYVRVLASVTGFIVLVLVIINILVSAQVSYWGYQLNQIQNKSAYLTEANRLLRQDITRQTSLSKFMDNARALGYTQSMALLRLPLQTPVAMRPLPEP